MFPSHGTFPTARYLVTSEGGCRMLLALHLLQCCCWYTTHTWGGFVDSRAKRILSTGLRSCRDRRLTNYDAGLGIAARSILTISRLAGASWVQPSRTAGCLV